MADNQYDTAGTPPRTDPSEAGEATPESVVSPELAALKAERDEIYDRLLRKTAEFDNYRKRVERERREHADQAVIDLLQQLLLVVDDFELRAERRSRRRDLGLSQRRRADPREAPRRAA